MSGCDWINLSYRTTTKHDNWFYLFFTGVSMEVKKHGYKEKSSFISEKKYLKKYADNYSPGGM